MKASNVQRVTDDRIARARAVAKTLDAAIRIPGTGIRVGADALLGLIPGLGDVAGAAFSAYLVLLGARIGLPASVIARMVGNVAIDTIVGGIPVIGDLFDIAWKSNLRNLALLEQATGTAPVKRASRWQLALALTLIGVLVVGGVALAIWIVGKAVALLG